MDTGLSSTLLENYKQDTYSYLNPFGASKGSDNNEPQHGMIASQDSSCQHGAEIFLKRIFNKLFQQVNDLQPSELDDEFIYQSTITYRDYLGMMKHIKNDAKGCSSLIDMENIISRVMSTADVRRPMHTSIFGSLIFPSSPLSFPGGGGLSITLNSLHMHLLMDLLLVGLIAWFLNTKLRVNMWKSLPIGILWVGFVKFCMHKNELNMRHRLNSERCSSPSTIARILSLVNYDYDNCASDRVHTSNPTPNIAFTGVEYLSELIFRPIVTFGDKLGKALQSYLNSFTGLNYIIAPFFPTIAIIAFFFVGIPIFYLFMRMSNRSMTSQRPTARYIKSPKKLKITNNKHHGNHAIK